MSTKTIIAMAAFIISLISNIVTFILERKKSGNLKSVKQNSAVKINELEGFITLIKDIVPKSIQYAEKCGLKSGELKKLVATNQIVANCNEKEIDVNSSEISSLIEAFIQFSNAVNSNKVEVAKSESVGSETVI